MFGNLVVGLGLNSRKFTQGLNKSEQRLGSFAGFVRGGLAAAVVGFTTLAASATVGAGLSMVTAAEQADVAFTTMLGSADAAKSLLGEIETFAASTPFQLQGLTESAQQLLAFGVAGDDVMNLMKTLGDLAAGTQKPLADFVDIFGKVKASGVAALGDVNRLADRGVPIYQALAKVMGKPQSEIRKLASTGKIGLNEIRSALESVVQEGGLFENSMEKQSQTLGGIWSTAKDNALFILRDITQAFVDGFDLKGTLSGVIVFLQGIRSAIRPALAFITQIIKTARAAFTGIFGFLTKGIGDLIGYFGTMLGTSNSTFEEIQLIIVRFLAHVEFGFGNMGEIFQLQMKKMQLAGLQTFNKLRAWFGNGGLANPGEQKLIDEIKNRESKLNKGLKELVDQRVLEFQVATGQKKAPGEKKLARGDAAAQGAEPGADKTAKSAGSFGAALKFSREAVSSIVRNVNQSSADVNVKILKANQQQVNEQKKQNKALNDVKDILKNNQGEAAMAGIAVGP